MNLAPFRWKLLLKAITPFGIIWWRQRTRTTLQLFLDGTTPTNVYGQFAEDLLLRMYLDVSEERKGFYVDIGAFHPTKFSNTHYYYHHGWRGVNIDANPHAIRLFNNERPRDINVESGVSDQPGDLQYYFFGDDASVNSFDREHALAMEKRFGYTIKEVRTIPVLPINELLGAHVPDGQHIDFMNIDVEGYDGRILRSLDFTRFAPDYLLMEDLENAGNGVEAVATTSISRFLAENGYAPIGCTRLTVLYKRTG